MLNALNKEKKYCLQINWIIIFSFSILIGMGMMIQYSVGQAKIYPFLFHQLTVFVVSIPLLILIVLTPNESLINISRYVYGVAITLLIISSIIGKKAMGATRWISIYGVNVQPSEIMKIALILMLAYMLRNMPDISTINRSLLKMILIIILPALIVLKQPNLGTALIICFIGITILFTAGLYIKYFIYLGIFTVTSMPIAWHFLYSYQKNRVLIFLGINEDPLGKGYNILQSKIAIGSGGIWGKGIVEGTQTQLKFLPEKHSDFVFTVLAEETGLIGALTLIIVYSIFCLESFYIGTRSSNIFNRITAIGISAMFFFHYIINVGMVMGMFPVVGIPLPFISYGGSIMLTSVIATGILLNIHKKNIINSTQSEFENI